MVISQTACFIRMENQLVKNTFLLMNFEGLKPALQNTFAIERAHTHEYMHNYCVILVQIATRVIRLTQSFSYLDGFMMPLTSFRMLILVP